MSTVQEISKANPLWDGDGLQGIGQLRGAGGRWAKQGRRAIRNAAKDALSPLTSRLPELRNDVKDGKRIDLVPGLVDERDPNQHVPYSRRNSFCYVYSAKFLLGNPNIKGARLVHGYTQVGNAKPINHSWVEMGNWIFEPNSGHTMSRKQFDKFFKPEREVEWTVEQLREFRKKTKHWGPWHEDDVSKARGIPLWDGDGVQGAGQPRDRRGRWVRLPGPTSLKKIGIWELDDGTFGVFKDGEEEPFKVYKSHYAANRFVAKTIKDDVKEYKDKVLYPKLRRGAKGKQEARNEEMRRAQPPTAPAPKSAGAKGRQSLKVHESTTERMPVPGQPTRQQVDDAVQKLRGGNNSNEEVKYQQMIGRLLLRRGITQDPAVRGDIKSKYGISPKRQVELENEIYDLMFPQRKAPRTPNLGGGVVHITDQQVKTMKEHGARKAIVLPAPNNPSKPERMFKATKGRYRGKWVKVSWNGTPSVMDEDDAIDAQYESKLFWAKHLLLTRKHAEQRARAYRAEQDRIRDTMDDDRRALKEWKIKTAAKWAEQQGFDPTDTIWHAIYWNDNSLLRKQMVWSNQSGGEDELTDIPMRIILQDPQVQQKMDPALLERLLALPDIDARDMRGHRPEGRRANRRDDDFVEASPESRQVDPEWESKNREREIKHNRRLKTAYRRYKEKHPKSKLTFEEFVDQKYNNSIRIPGGKREGIKKRKQPAGYERETERIKENKKIYGGTVHRFKAANWTHPNGHPRCIRCGDEQPISRFCNKAPDEKDHARFQSMLDRDFGRVEKAQVDWDGDGVQGAGQVRGPDGRWIDSGGAMRRGIKSATRSAGYAHPTNRRSPGARPSAGKTAIAGNWDHKKKGLREGVKFTRLQGREHQIKGPDGKRLAKKDIPPERAAYLRNNGPTKITNARLKVLNKDRTKATQEEKDLLLSAAAQKHIDGDEQIKIYSIKHKMEKPRPRYEVMSNIAREIANDEFRKQGGGEKGRGGQQVRRLDAKAKARQEKERIKVKESGRSVWESKAKRQWLIDEFGDGEKAKCIICGKGGLTTATVSPERIKPGTLGGKYEEGNVAPAHWSCNVGENNFAQFKGDAKFEYSLRDFAKVYKEWIDQGYPMGGVLKKYSKELKRMGLA